jgi:hypothetical protein
MTDTDRRGHHLWDLEEVYPPETVAEIDRRGARPQRHGSTGLRGRAAAGGLAAGLLLGVREAMEPEPERPEVVEVDLSLIPDGEGVHLVLVRGAPAASRAWITPAPSR